MRTSYFFHGDPSSEGTIARVDGRTGAIVSTAKPDATLIPRSVPRVSGDSVLVLLTDAGADYRVLVSLDRTLAAVRWRQSAPKNWSTSRAFVWQHSVLVGTPTGEVTAYCLKDGSRGWSQAIGGYIRAIGGVDDWLYVGTSNGHLSALRASSGCPAT